MVDLTVRFQAI